MDNVADHKKETEGLPPSPPRRLNLRTPEVMACVQAQVEHHYRSSLIERIRAEGSVFQAQGITIHLAKEFGFCYGVERAIDLAYAARKVFPEKRIFILGEIIHNPEVNHQIDVLGIQNLITKEAQPDLSLLQKDDIVIVPAFGAEVALLNEIKKIGCQIVDTTCGDVMSVWKRVQQNASENATSIIHGKASHEETRATASRALGKQGTGHYLIVLNLEEVEIVCHYMRKGGDPEAFLQRFSGSHSPGFHPDIHLKKVGVANQTTMLRGETEEVQRRLREALIDRDGSDSNFRYFDTICGATQERQDALFHLLRSCKLDFLLVIGGYNSSNTTHLAEIGATELPTYFIRNSQCLESKNLIRHFHVILKKEIETLGWLPPSPLKVGITAGASCPNNLIEETIQRLLELVTKEHALNSYELVS